MYICILQQRLSFYTS